VEKFKLKGELLESHGRVKIFRGFPHNFYDISKPKYSEKNEKISKTLISVILRTASLNQLQTVLPSSLVEEFRKKVGQQIDIWGLTQKLPKPDQFDTILVNLSKIIKQLGIPRPKSFAKYVLSQSIGYKELSEMMADKDLEEVMINGSDKNVFVFHKKYGMCRTNVVSKENGFVFNFIMRIAQSVGKQFSEAHPLLDARLPDGSRANATFSYVTPFGHSLTIRKFSKVPLSIIHLIENKTFSTKLAAFLWIMVEGLNVEPMNAIITGGAGSGKTTLMNVLSGFIPFQSRVISIEDTLELDLGERQNWIQMESKPILKDIAAVSMDDLLKNALRMRPDRILVGEVRGPEAQTLFVAMDTGHSGILGTVHSNTAREMMLRLRSSPMNVPVGMLPLLDLAIVMQRSYNKKIGIIRRVKQVAEISRMDEKVLQSNIFEFNRKRDRIEKTNVPSRVIEILAERAGLTKNELKREMVVRQRILEWLLETGRNSRLEVEGLIQKYYFDPESVLKKITGVH
jgi:flagellar protein FlaI